MNVLFQSDDSSYRRDYSWNKMFYELQGMIALRRGATELQHEDYMDAIIEVQAKKKANLQYYAWYNYIVNINFCNLTLSLELLLE